MDICSVKTAFFQAFAVTLLVTNAVSASTSVTPNNTLVRLGQPASLPCCCASDNCPLEWFFAKWDTQMFIKVCDKQEKRCAPGYSADSRNSRCFNLNINSTTSDVTGLYQCTYSNSVKVGAYLVAHNITCGTNITADQDLVESDFVELWCIVFWRGKLPFETRWYDENGILQKRNTTEEVNPTARVSLSVQLSRPELQTYSVEFSLLDEGIEDAARNRPKESFKFPKKKVSYPAREILLSCPMDGCERPIGGTLHCFADGNPVPELNWTNWKRDIVGSGSVLTLEFVGTQEYTCTARSVIRGKEYKLEKTIKVNVMSNHSDIVAKQIEASLRKLVDLREQHSPILTVINSTVAMGLTVIFVIVCLVYNAAKRFNFQK